MKKLVLFTLLSVMGYNSYSQSSDKTTFRFGGGGNYVSEINGIYGTGLIGLHVSKRFEFLLSYTYMPKSKSIKYHLINTDGHYIINPLNEHINFYGLLGVGTLIKSVEIIAPAGTSETFETSINIGVGFNLYLARRVLLAPEFKVTFLSPIMVQSGITLQFAL